MARQDYRSQHCRLFPENCFTYNGQLNSKIVANPIQSQPRSENSGQRLNPTTAKFVPKSKFNPATKPKEKSTINPFSLIGDAKPFQSLKYRNVAKVAKNSDPRLKQLQDDMFLISGAKDVDGYETVIEGQKFKLHVNPEEQKMRITFEGAQGTPEDTLNVLNIVKNKKLVGKDVEEEEAFLAELFKNGTKSVEFDGVVYNDIKMLGHSLGGFKARKYGAKYNIDSELLNAHIMPWNKFESTTAQTNMHTIVTDPLDFKYLIQPTDSLTHTYYQPLQPDELEFAKNRIGDTREPSIIDPHYSVSFQDLDREDQSELTEIFKTRYPELFANAGIAALGIAGSIYEAANNKDYDPKTDPMLGAANEAGIVGFNIDPDYQWGDTAPSGPADYLIWKSLQPFVKAVASPTNPDLALKNDEALEKAGGSTLSSELYTFDFGGEEYYYEKDSSGSPIWFSDDGKPLSQDVKNAYNEANTPKEPEPEQDFTDNYRV